MSFVNISCSYSKTWDPNEIRAARATGQSNIFDIQPPAVPDNAEAADVRHIAENTISCAVRDGDAVLVDVADNHLAHCLIEALKRRGRVTVWSIVGCHSALKRFRKIL